VEQPVEVLEVLQLDGYGGHGGDLAAE